MINEKITLNPVLPGATEYINAAQGENNARSLSFVVVGGDGQPIDLSGCTAVFYVDRKTSIAQVSATISDGVITVVLPSGACNVPGEWGCWLQIIKPDAYDLRVDNLILRVQPCNFDGVAEASDDFTLLTQLIVDAQQTISSANAATESANTAAGNATSAASQATDAAESANTAAQSAASAAQAANTAAEGANSAASQATSASQSAAAATDAANTAATAAENALNDISATVHSIINDTTPSPNTVYSSQKVQGELDTTIKTTGGKMTGKLFFDNNVGVRTYAADGTEVGLIMLNNKNNLWLGNVDYDLNNVTMAANTLLHRTGGTNYPILSALNAGNYTGKYTVLWSGSKSSGPITLEEDYDQFSYFLVAFDGMGTRVIVPRPYSGYFRGIGGYSYNNYPVIYVVGGSINTTDKRTISNIMGTQWSQGTGANTALTFVEVLGVK